MTGRCEVITTFRDKIPRSRHSAAFKIFHYRFICVLAQKHLYTAEYLQKGGYVTTEDQETDRALANYQVHAQLTIAAMAEYHSQGIAFKLANPKDAAVIYRTLQAHLQDWKRAVEDQFTMVKPPMADLRKFEDLAEVVYPWAAYDLREKPFDSVLADKVAAIAKRRGGATRVTRPTSRPLPLPKHQPMVDAIARVVSERAKTWR